MPKKVTFSENTIVESCLSSEEYDRSTIEVAKITAFDFTLLDKFRAEFYPITNYNVEITKAWRYSPIHYRAQTVLHNQVQSIVSNQKGSKQREYRVNSIETIDMFSQSVKSVKYTNVNSTKWNLNAEPFIPLVHTQS